MRQTFRGQETPCRRGFVCDVLMRVIPGHKRKSAKIITQWHINNPHKHTHTHTHTYTHIHTHIHTHTYTHTDTYTHTHTHTYTPTHPRPHIHAHASLEGFSTLKYNRQTPTEEAEPLWLEGA